MVLGSSIGRCETNNECEYKYGQNSQCLNMKNGVGHCSFSPMYIARNMSGGKKKKSTKKRRQKCKKGTRRKRSTKK